MLSLRFRRSQGLQSENMLRTMAGVLGGGPHQCRVAFWILGVFHRTFKRMCEKMQKISIWWWRVILQ